MDVNPQEIGLEPAAGEPEVLDGETQPEPEGELNADTSPEEGEGTPPATEDTPEAKNEKRINDLMSKWQGAEARANKLEGRLEAGKGQPQQPAQQAEAPFYHKQGWVPQDYNELQKALVLAEQRGEQKVAEALKQMESKRQAADTQLSRFVDDVKLRDPTFDESDFFDYAKKHDFSIKNVSNLKAIYSSYAEVRGAGARGAQLARKNIKERKADTVSGAKGGKGSGYSVPLQTLRKSGSAVEAVMDALSKK